MLTCCEMWNMNFILTEWCRVRHIWVDNLTIIGSDNGLSPGRRQAIIWISDGILWIWPLGINFSEILIKFLTFWFKKMCLNVSFAKWRPFCLGLNVLSCIVVSRVSFPVHVTVRPFLLTVSKLGSAIIYKTKLVVTGPRHNKLSQFLPEASFGLPVLSLPASVCVCVRMCASTLSLSAR